MLKPAILYKDEILEGFEEYFYSDDMLYETGSMYNWIPNISEETRLGDYQWAIVGGNGKLIGYLAYSIDYYADKVYNFGLISFDRGNPLVGKTVYEEMEKLIKRFHRVEWRAVDGNPACRGYDRFIEKHGGIKHVLKDAVRDKYGNYHDDLIYEVVN